MSVVYLLDTNVVSEPARPTPNAGVLMQLRTHFSEIAIPSIVVHELFYGLARMPDGKKKQEIAEYINELVLGVIEVIPYDEKAAVWHAKERARLQTMGIIRPFADGQIASIAATNSLILVTRNERDFQHYEGLCIENWYVDP